MASPEKTIETKVKAFAKDITKFLEDKRKAKVDALKKKADKKGGDAEAKSGAKGKAAKAKTPEEQLVTVTFAYSSAAGSVSRSPEAQAEYVSAGTSWTCAGAHLIDKARHVKMLYGPAGKKASMSWDLKGAFGSGDEHFCTLSELKTKWNALMKTHDLKNHKGGDGWGEGDAFHFELDDSKVPRTDKRVQSCLAHYAKITRLEGKKKNAKFEGSWKKDLEPHLKEVEEELKRREEEKAREALKALRFSGSAAGSQTLLKNANASASKTGTTFPKITFVGPLDAGKETLKSHGASARIEWDALPPSVFEWLGLTKTKGVDVWLSCGVDYTLATYENLSQTFLVSLVPHCQLTYDTPAAKKLKMTVTATSSVGLAKAAMVPKGTVIFEAQLITPKETLKGKVTVKIDGATASATGKTG